MTQLIQQDMMATKRTKVIKNFTVKVTSKRKYCNWKYYRGIVMKSTKFS